MESGNVIRISRNQVDALESVMREMPNQLDVDAITSHYFAPGIYLRSLFMPAGSVAVGKVHRHETMNILISGTMQVTTDDGVATLQGPAIFNTRPGTKKVAHAITDCLFCNIHPTKLTKVADIEAKFIQPEPRLLIEEKQ